MNSGSKVRFIQGAIACAILALSGSAMALKSDTKQPIKIDSTTQSIDLEKNITIFSTDVIITQGSIDIRANKVVVTRPNGDNSKIIVEAFGNPVTFYQQQDNGKPIKGKGQQMRYEMDKELIILTGNAFLEQLDSSIKGDKITYLVPTQKMEAFSDKGKRVTTVLLPAQIQEKGPNATPNASKSK